MPFFVRSTVRHQPSVLYESTLPHPSIHRNIEKCLERAPNSGEGHCLVYLLKRLYILCNSYVKNW